MSAEQQTNREAARQLLLDRLSSEKMGDAVGAELFEISDLLQTQHALLRALTDPGRAPADRQALAKSLLGGKVSETTLDVLVLLAGQHWSKPATFAKALDDLGVQAILDGAKRSGDLSQVEDELFAINQLAGAERDLRIQLSDVGGADDTERQRIADMLLEGRVLPATLALVKRAIHVSGRGHIMGTLRRYGVAAADAHGAQLVTVSTASELSEEQLARLKEIIKQQVGRDVSLTVAVEPELIGGFHINYGDEAADSSIRSELGMARRQLTK